MDPDVVNAPLYVATISDDLKSIPTLSVVTDVDSLFGPQNGIYMHTGQRGDEWERSASVELIFPDGSDPGFQKKCGIRIQGESSRNPSNRKHSLSLRFRGNYGGDLAYPFFQTAVIRNAPVETFREIRLFAGHQNSWHSGYGGNPARAQFLHDTFARDTLTEMGQLSSHAISVHLYLNGLYWGLYGAKERPDEDFLASYLGGSDQDYDVFKDNELESGDSVALDTLLALTSADMTSLANYQAALGYVDVENLADYMLMNFYVGNHDWGYHNWIVARKREPGAGFMFFSWDAEIILGGVREYNLENAGPLGVYGDLRSSPEFRLLFADRVHRHLFNGGALTPRKAAERFLERSAEIDRAVVGESARWGDRLRASNPYTRDNEWLVEKVRLLLEYFPARATILLARLRARGLYPNVAAPSFNQHGGAFFPGFQLAMNVPAGTVYYTEDGSDPRLPGGTVSPSAQVYGVPLTLTNSVHIASRAQVSGEWSALNEASFVRETPVRITELMYNAPGGSDFDFVELENIGVTPVDLSGLRFAEGIDFTFPSMSLAAGSHVLAVKNQVAFESLYGAGKPIAGVYGGNLANSGERLLLEDPQGNPIHDFEFIDSWYPTTDGGGYSLVIRDARADKAAWAAASGWRASTFVNGSPAAMEIPLCSDGVDNDGDGAIDLADPGCGGASQDLEDPECNDGLDNDGDGGTDLADAECASASDLAEAVAAVDSSLCYQVEPDASAPILVPVVVTLSDQFDAGVRFTALVPQSLCLPGRLNGAPVLDEMIHLESYKIREVPGEPRHGPQTGLQVESQFGPLFIATARPDRLLVPTARDAGAPPDPSAHDVDAYKCYTLKLPPDAPRYFPRRGQANFEDAFEHRDYTLRRPRRFCTPVGVNGAAIKNPAGYLLCYPAKRTTFEPLHTRRLGVDTANLLGAEVLDTRREDELCLPARLIGP